MKTHNYIVAGAKPWNRRIFDKVIVNYPGNWHFIDRPADLTAESIAGLAPRYIFFLHWSWIVPSNIVNEYECVCFHMTDVPYGRGGSPLQNLIIRGHQHTKLTALRMIETLDAGPVYVKEDLCLGGSAEEIYLRACYLAATMIRRIIENQPTPKPQTGDPVLFKRRQPHESEIQTHPDLRALHDFIRMLDAHGYPPAFLEHAGFRYEFSRAALYDGRIVADVEITPVDRSAPWTS
jgi:methionyl-tRNA formyltransferase